MMRKLISVLLCVAVLAAFVPVCVAHAESESVTVYSENAPQNDEANPAEEDQSFWAKVKEEWYYFWFDVFLLTYIFVGGTLVNIFLGPLSWFQN